MSIEYLSGETRAPLDYNLELVWVDNSEWRLRDSITDEEKYRVVLRQEYPYYWYGYRMDGSLAAMKKMPPHEAWYDLVSLLRQNYEDDKVNFSQD